MFFIYKNCLIHWIVLDLLTWCIFLYLLLSKSSLRRCLTVCSRLGTMTAMGASLWRQLSNVKTCPDFPARWMARRFCPSTWKAAKQTMCWSRRQVQPLSFEEVWRNPPEVEKSQVRSRIKISTRAASGPNGFRKVLCVSRLGHFECATEALNGFELAAYWKLRPKSNRGPQQSSLQVAWFKKLCARVFPWKVQNANMFSMEVSCVVPLEILQLVYPSFQLSAEEMAEQLDWWTAGHPFCACEGGAMFQNKSVPSLSPFSFLFNQKSGLGCQSLWSAEGWTSEAYKMNVNLAIVKVDILSSQNQDIFFTRVIFFADSVAAMWV